MFLFIGNCNRYEFQDCNNLEYSDYQYEILKKDSIGENLYIAHIYVHFPKRKRTSYDMIACAAIDICKKESLLEAYFYSRNDCFFVEENTMKNIDVYDVPELYDCYIGNIKLNQSKDGKDGITPYDFNFLSPPAKVKF